MRGLMMLAAGVGLSLCTFLPAISQKMLSIRPHKPIICYQSFENRHDHVGLSDKFKQLRQKSAGRVKTATIEVEYVNFPADNLAKTAFQFAVNIWETELMSAVPIRIRADWRALSPGVLGQALWGSAHANFGGEQHLNTFYPVALAEKIAGRELNEPIEPDIVASFNSNASWYFGVDGNTPSGKMDMVTIVLHEIAHGLGFTDTYDVEGTQGSVGLSSGGTSVPFIFDVFVENVSNKNLMQDLQSPSQALATQLQSSNLFFDSPLSVVALDGVRPKLYAPSSFDNGSSISHLDESTFNAQQDANRLMTPQIAFAESIHEPGDVLLAALADLGWVYTRIDHNPLGDTERKDGQPYDIITLIKSDNGYDPASVKLHYTTDGSNFTVVSMTPTGVADRFKFSLPGTTVNKSYAYFISVTDDSDRIFTSPGKMQEIGKAPEQGTHFFRIGPDLEEPEILHDPAEFISENKDELFLTAEVTDNLGVKEVVVEYMISDGPLQTVVMQKDELTDEFSVTVNLPDLSPADEIRYRLLARDLSSAENISSDPENDFHIVDVIGILPVQDLYTNNFDAGSEDFFGENFRVATPSAFKNGAIHSDHPYENGAGANGESHYTYQLQIPIRINDVNPVIRFDEIVLVEPGVEGSVFGAEDFYDYVIVEGSADGGVSWQPFAPGYDARANDVWLNRYNAGVSDDNSESDGDSTLFRQRSIDMLENENFSEGDEVLVRFRLFADQFAHGWGWAIDNLSIQTPVTGLEQPLSNELNIFPVPARSELFVELANPHDAPVSIRISDAMGRIVFDESVSGSSGQLHRRINVQFFKDGLYVLKAQAGPNLYVRKFLKVAD